MANKLWQDKTDEEFGKDIRCIAEGFREWILEDYIKTKDDLYNLLWAGLDEIKEPMNEKDFEYLLILCQDVLDIAKKRGWKK